MMTFGILKAISLLVPLRSPMHEAQNGDIAIHDHSLELAPLDPFNGRIAEPVAS
ncbi:MAG: hypothetical protein ACR2KS_06890 [Candidatus Eremiobacter antarcticus]|nr:hypothetical protein [Candidatus Eremiobacteraeota bacterium]MBC5806980.1 hypothetical protein [Candidatus Eremiobacteraeota bacterium]